MQRRNRAQWREIVMRWKSSGEPARSFASRHGVNPGTMKWWSYRFRAEERQAAESSGVAELVEVVASTSERSGAVDGRSGGLRLAVGGNVAMVFERVPDAGYLAAFVQAVERPVA